MHITTSIQGLLASKRDFVREVATRVSVASSNSSTPRGKAVARLMVADARAPAGMPASGTALNGAAMERGRGSTAVLEVFSALGAARKAAGARKLRSALEAEDRRQQNGARVSDEWPQGATQLPPMPLNWLNLSVPDFCEACKVRWTWYPLLCGRLSFRTH